MKKKHIGTVLLVFILIVLIALLINDLGYTRGNTVYRYTYMNPGTAQVISNMMVDTCDQNPYGQYPVNSISSENCARYYGNVSYPPVFYYGPGTVTSR